MTGMNTRRAVALALVGWYLLLPLGGCSSRYPYCGVGDSWPWMNQADYPCPLAQLMGVETCQSSDGKWGYLPKDGEPQACLDYAEAMQAEAERQREAAERQRQEEIRELFAESPVQSEQGFKHDIELANKLTPTQLSALRDVTNNVILTADEQKALASIDLDQWHAITQLAAFYKWRNEKIQEAKAEAEREQQENEREEEELRLENYQSLMTEAAERQADAAQWQAAAAWRQQQCLSNMSRGFWCY